MGILIDILKEIPINAVLRDKLQELEKRYEELEFENTQLKGENQSLKSKVKELTSTGGLGENETKILILLSLHNQALPDELIAGELGLSLTKTKYYLEKMWKQYVYSYDYTNERPSGYYLTQKGREYLVENDLVE